MKKKTGIIYLSIFLAFCGIAAAGISYNYNYVKKWDRLIYPGTYIENIDVSGLTKENAVKAVDNNYSKSIVNKKISVETPDKEYTISYSNLNAKYNIEEIVNKAFDRNKNLGLFGRYKSIKKITNINYKLTLDYNQNKLKSFIDGIEKETNISAQNASIKMSDSGGFTIMPGQNGSKLEKDALIKEISDQIGSNVDSEIKVKAKYDSVSASITKDKLSSINAMISSFSTEFASRSSAERANNIAIATKSINGTLLMPGDVFSFNNTVGQRTAAKGYLQAPVIIDNKVDSDFGGGICQVSSTLYNAMLRADIRATERVHHTLPSSYVSLGMDATVDFGNIDYKFKNTLSYPIYIQSYTSGGNICFNIFSNSSLKSKSYDLSSEVYATIQPGTKYVDDSTMPAGQTEVVQNPYTGYKVKVYMKTIQNGAVIAQDMVSDDFYRPVDGIIKRGTKK